MKHTFTLCCCALLLTAATVDLRADGPASTAVDSNATAQPGTPDAAQADASHDSGNAVSTPTPEGLLSRWLTLDEFSFSSRYRNMYNTNGRRVFDDGQERSIIKGKLKLDKEGKYFIGFRVASGTYFNWAYASFAGDDYGSSIVTNRAFYSPEHSRILTPTRTVDPIGKQVLTHLVANGWSMYVRDLYASASPVGFLTFEYGAIPLERGAGSEITTFDEDGYISGGRIRVKAPSYLFVDQVASTIAYFGDVTTPNLFERGQRFGQANYRQFLADKHLGSRIYASVDYTSQIGTHTMREAVRLKVPELKAFSGIRAEFYQRPGSRQLPAFLARSGSGWSVSANQTVRKTVSFEAGYADIDQDYGVYSGSSLLTAGGFSLNGDAYQIGKRFYGRIAYKPSPYVSFFSFYTHEVDPQRNPAYFDFNRQGWNGGVTLDFKALLSRQMHLL